METYQRLILSWGNRRGYKGQGLKIKGQSPEPVARYSCYLDTFFFMGSVPCVLWDGGTWDHALAINMNGHEFSSCETHSI